MKLFSLNAAIIGILFFVLSIILSAFNTQTGSGMGFVINFMHWSFQVAGWSLLLELLLLIPSLIIRNEFFYFPLSGWIYELPGVSQFIIVMFYLLIGYWIKNHWFIIGALLLLSAWAIWQFTKKINAGIDEKAVNDKRTAITLFWFLVLILCMPFLNNVIII